ncbi:MAG: ATP-binding protein, partial [Halobacteriaceae archaeon]
MASHRLQAKSPYLIRGIGVVLFLISVIHHARELYALNGLVGPIIAFFLDGLPALGLVSAGYWLSGTDLSVEERWHVCIWCLLGATLFFIVMGLSLLIRVVEGRIIGEPIFPLLIAIETGGLAGVISGFYSIRAQKEARHAETVSNVLGFVNDLIRHDLRNDLNVIQGRADLIDADDGSVDSEVVSDSVSIIVEKSDEALTRIENTGAVAETLTGEPELERIDLVAITAEMATRIENSYDLDVSTDLPDQAFVDANAGLRSVVDNLIENAVVHNDAAQPQVHVEVVKTTESVKLSVADNGPGIPDK